MNLGKQVKPVTAYYLFATDESPKEKGLSFFFLSLREVFRGIGFEFEGVEASFFVLRG